MSSRAASPDPRARRTRRAIQLALQHLLTTTRFDQITIRQIVSGAAIAYPTFFRHFPDKESVLKALAEEEIGALLDVALPIFTSGDLQGSTLLFCEHVQASRGLWSVLLTGGAASNIRAAFVAALQARAERWPPRTDWLPADVGARILTGLALDVLAWWLGEAPHESPEKVAGILSRFFTLVVV